MKQVLALIILFSILTVANAQTGCLKGDCHNGTGTYKFENSDEYTGEWKDGNRTGYGRYDWSDGSYYIGYFLTNLLNGQGSYYSATGSDMVGWFIENNYQGVDRPKNFDSYSEINDNDILDDYETDDLEELLEEWETSDAENERIKVENLRSAKYADFITVMETVIKEFEDNFENLKGPAEKSIIEFGDSWFSNTLVKGTDEASITTALLSDNHTWYNILYKGSDFYTVKRKYEEYVTIFNEKLRSNCCTLVYDKYNDYKSDGYESYGTYWITFLVQEGYSDIYSDLLVEIEMTSGIIGGGYQVLVRVSHLSNR
ncbi:MAG: hypothetical protein H7Y00_08590 [Fimbriimonadaceae bacterium]|nr:hypothetical protein [Chitinophagales bacterium]